MLDTENLCPLDDGVAVVLACKTGTCRIVHVPIERLLVWHLDHLNLERIAVASFDDDVPREDATAVIRQQRKHLILERRKLGGTS
jgi:pantothenate kinase-related protein Tda10